MIYFLYILEAPCKLPSLLSDSVGLGHNKASAVNLLWEMISSGEETLGVAKGPGEAAGHRFIWTMEDAFLEEASREDHPLHDIMVASQVPSLSCSLHKGRDPTHGFERGMCIKH